MTETIHRAVIKAREISAKNKINRNKQQQKGYVTCKSKTGIMINTFQSIYFFNCIHMY